MSLCIVSNKWYRVCTTYIFLSVQQKVPLASVRPAFQFNWVHSSAKEAALSLHTAASRFQLRVHLSRLTYVACMGMYFSFHLLAFVPLFTHPQFTDNTSSGVSGTCMNIVRIEMVVPLSLRLCMPLSLLNPSLSARRCTHREIDDSEPCSLALAVRLA